MKDLENEIIKAKSYEDKGEVYKSYKILKKNFSDEYRVMGSIFMKETNLAKALKILEPWM